MADWLYQHAGQTLGPVPARQLAEMALDGRLQPTDLVHRADRTDWVEASRVQGLRFTPSEPPPMPKSPQPAEPVLTAIPIVAPEAVGVGRRILLEIKATIATTMRHMASKVLRQRQAAHVSGMDRRRVLIGYGTAAASLASLVVLLSWSLQMSPSRRDPDRQVATPEASQGSTATPATAKRQRENSGVPKSPSRTAYESLEILFYEEAATPFVLNLVVIAQLDDHTYEIGLPQQIGDQRAILRTADTIFNSKGRAQIAAQGDGSREVRNKDGFTVRYPAYKEALSEAGAFVLTVKDAREMQADVVKRIKQAQEDLVKSLLSDGYKGKDTADLKKYLDIDIDPQILNQALIDNRLRGVQRDVEKQRPSG